MKEIIIRSYAKVNLSLDVKGLLEDGYHDVEMVMQQVGLYDTVKISWQPGEKEGHEIRLRVNKPYLPTDERNLAYKAALLAIKYCEYKIPSGIISIDINKKIPVAAGLAGGSGNGAAVLHGLNRLFNLGMDVKRLCKIGAELGSDVPFSIMGQAKVNYCLGKKINRDKLATSCALATGTGTKLEPREGMDKYLILVKPALGVSTKEVYQGIDQCVINKRPETKMLLEGLKEGNDTKTFEAMENVLEAYTLNHYPKVEEVKEMVKKETDAKKVMMSGSGPTIFAIFNDKEAAVNACNHIRTLGHECYWARTTR